LAHLFGKNRSTQVKETQGTQRWLKLIERVPLIEKSERLVEILLETEELVKIFITSIKTAKEAEIIRY
jgi:hypothetical protein